MGDFATRPQLDADSESSRAGFRAILQDFVEPFSRNEFETSACLVDPVPIEPFASSERRVARDRDAGSDSESGDGNRLSVSHWLILH